MKSSSDQKNKKSQKNSWICQNETILISSPVLNVVKQECISSENEKEFTFYLLKAHHWCNIIPITEDGKIVLVHQYRIGVADHTYEIPGGVTDPLDLDIQATALRELEEETGYSPLPHAQVTALGWNYPNPAMQDNRCFSFIVGPVAKSKNQNLDPGEMIDVIEVPIQELPNWIREGKLNHALILNSFLHLLLQDPQTDLLLIEQLKRFKSSPTDSSDERPHSEE